MGAAIFFFPRSPNVFVFSPNISTFVQTFRYFFMFFVFSTYPFPVSHNFISGFYNSFGLLKIISDFRETFSEFREIFLNFYEIFWFFAKYFSILRNFFEFLQNFAKYFWFFPLKIHVFFKIQIFFEFFGFLQIFFEFLRNFFEFCKIFFVFRKKFVNSENKFRNFVKYLGSRYGRAAFSART